jgi:hypothetical protein
VEGAVGKTDDGCFIEFVSRATLTIPNEEPASDQSPASQCARCRLSRVLESREPHSRIEINKFSQLVVEQPWIAEIDLNPLLASSEGLLALDARVLLHDPSLRPDQLPKPTIRPYPSQYTSQFTMKDGAEVTLRPIRPEDEPLMGKLP